jgi:hypothetical protein
MPAPPDNTCGADPLARGRPPGRPSAGAGPGGPGPEVTPTRGSAPHNPFSTLRRFLPAAKAEHCDLCGVVLRPEHGHLLDLNTRRVVCSCEPCAVLFQHRGGTSPYRRIGRDVRRLAEPPFTDAQWESLLIPIGLAFFVFNSRENRAMGFYPGPAGATLSSLSIDIPLVGELEPDVEALLVNRVGGAGEYYAAPIDRCYALTGLIRKHWHGLSGGEEAWEAVGRFFAGLREAAVG